MDLRSIKKEAHSLPPLSQNLPHFKENWLKPLQKDNHDQDSKLNFLNNLDSETKQHIQQKLILCDKLIKEINDSHIINKKLQFFARYLIELKLTLINGDQSKGSMITNRILNDEFYSLKNSLAEINHFFIQKNEHSVSSF